MGNRNLWTSSLESGNRLLVLLAIQQVQGNQQSVSISEEEIGRLCRISTRQVQRIIRELLNRECPELIRVTPKRGRAAASYRIADAVDADAVDAVDAVDDADLSRHLDATKADMCVYKYKYKYINIKHTHKQKQESRQKQAQVPQDLPENLPVEAQLWASTHPFWGLLPPGMLRNCWNNGTPRGLKTQFQEFQAQAQTQRSIENATNGTPGTPAYRWNRTTGGTAMEKLRRIASQQSQNQWDSVFV